MPLNPSGNTPTSSLGVVVAGQRGSGLAGQFAQHRRGEHQVGAEQPQVAMRRVAVMYSHAAHHAVERPDRAGVIGDEQGPALARHVVHADDVRAEPVVEQRPERRQHHLVGQIGIEPELVDLVLAGQPPAQERQAGGDALLQRGRVGRFRSGHGLGRRRRRLGRPVCSAPLR
jgi:hypothetical protein